MTERDNIKLTILSIAGLLDLTDISYSAAGALTAVYDVAREIAIKLEPIDGDSAHVSITMQARLGASTFEVFTGGLDPVWLKIACVNAAASAFRGENTMPQILELARRLDAGAVLPFGDTWFRQVGNVNISVSLDDKNCFCIVVSSDDLPDHAILLTVDYISDTEHLRGLSLPMVAALHLMCAMRDTDTTDTNDAVNN